MAILTTEKVTEDSGDQTLAEAFLNGDEFAFVWLMERYKNEVSRYAWRITWEAAAADHVVLETFARLHKGGLKRGDVFKTALFSLTHRLSLRALKDEATQEKMPAFGGAAGSPDGMSSRNREGMRLEIALGGVPVGHRAMLLLYYAHRLSPEEASRVLEVRPQQFRRQLAYARRLLRDGLRMEL